MALPPPHGASATHTLLSDDYPTALRALVAAVSRDATHAFVRLDRAELDHDADGAARCRRVWDEVRPAFTPTEVPGSTDGTSWYRTAVPANAEALDRLLELVDGHIGTFFVHTVALAESTDDPGPAGPHAADRSAHDRRDDDRRTVERCDDDRRTGERRTVRRPIGDLRWRARAVPHHSRAVLTDDDLALVAVCEDALAPLRACVVETGTQVEWTADGRRYRVAGGSICRESLDGRWSTCFGLTGLRFVDRSDERTVRLTWRRPDRPDSRLLATLAGVVDRLSPDAPTILHVPDVATAHQVAAVLEDMLERYDPSPRNAERTD